MVEIKDFLFLGYLIFLSDGRNLYNNICCHITCSECSGINRDDCSKWYKLFILLKYYFFILIINSAGSLVLRGTTCCHESC